MNKLSEKQQQIDAFHKHLDECKQCRDNPFGLCATGAKLLHHAAGVIGVAVTITSEQAEWLVQEATQDCNKSELVSEAIELLRAKREGLLGQVIYDELKENKNGETSRKSWMGKEIFRART